MPTTSSTRIPPRRAAVAQLGLLAAAVLLAACGTSSSGTGQGAAAPVVPSVAPGALLGTERTPLGTLLVDGNGKTLYVFAADSPGRSSCDATCLAYWPAVTVPATLPASEPGITATLGALVRQEGTRQLTVDGWPVYTYVGDSGPGLTRGQGLNNSGGLWWVVSSTGSQVMKAPPAPAGAGSPAARGAYGY